MGMHFAPPPVVTLSQALASFKRDQLEDLISAAIDLLDFADGDPDDEDDERGGEMMVSAGVDYDPELDVAEPDGMPGDVDDHEDSEAGETLIDMHGRYLPYRTLADLRGNDDEVDCCGAHDDYGTTRAPGEGDGKPGDPLDSEFTYTEWHTRGRWKVDTCGTEDCRNLSGWRATDEAEDDHRAARAPHIDRLRRHRCDHAISSLWIGVEPQWQLRNKALASAMGDQL